MSTTEQKTLVANAYKALCESQGLSPRPQQQSMIRAGMSLFTKGSMGIVEAATGTGKSFGYLIPGIAAALTEDRVLVISTATASLQDQLANKDIPMALKAFKDAGYSAPKTEAHDTEAPSVIVLKGRERHMCPLKLEAHGQGDLLDETPRVGSKMLDLWNSGQWDGTRDTLEIPIDWKEWSDVANTSSSCIGRKCRLINSCPYYLVQGQIKTARIIITNHDYLLSNLANNPNSRIRDENAIYIFDEGHHLPDKIIDSFANKIDFGQNIAEKLDKIVNLLPNGKGVVIDLTSERLRSMWQTCVRSAMTMLGDAKIHRFKLGDAPEIFKGQMLELGKVLAYLKEEIGQARDELKTHIAKNKRVEDEEVLIQVNEVVSAIEDATKTIEDFCSDSRIARWIASNRFGVEVCCSPFDPAEKAKKHLWPTIKRGLITSATISSLGSFESIIRTLGLPSDTPTLKLDSPFDFSKTKMVIPKFTVDGNDKSHASMVKAFMADRVMKTYEEHVGVLVYFASKALMNECYEALSPVQKSQILLQGHLQPSALLDEHRKRIDRGMRSVIFGLDSVGEGIDLPGKYCSLVVITKLPFPVPDDPVMATHSEVLVEKGLDPFVILTLPKAGLKLAQLCGRLVRREGDYGEITVLDRRLVTKRYGSRLLSGTAFKDRLQTLS